MNTKKHHLNDKLQKSSKLFLQLGLVLALLISYTILEISSLEKSLPQLAQIEPEADPYILPEIPNEIIIEKKEKPKVTIREPKKTNQLNSFKQQENIEPLIKEIFKPEDPIENIDKAINNIIEEKPVDPEPKLLLTIEKAPIFPGCENLNNKEAKKCFTQKIAAFVNNKFDTSLAEKLGLSGEQRIYAQFVIDKFGKVKDIKVKAPHKELEAEANSIIEELPQMIPGVMQNKNVPVRYTLPIKFKIYN